MPTTWSMTAREIVLDALSLLNVVGAGETPNGNDYALAVRTFNALLKELSLHGYAWPNLSLVETAVSWSSGAPSYVTVPADYSSDLFLTRGDAAGNRIEMEGLTRRQWLELPNKTMTGTFPTKFYEDVDGKVYLWPVPTQDPALKASYIQKVDDVVLTSAPDVSASGALALQWGLAAHLAPHFERDPAPFAAAWGVKRDDLIANGVSTAPVIFEILD